METRSPTWLVKVPRHFAHLVVACLLAIIVIRALTGPAPRSAAVVAAGWGVIYAAGGAMTRVHAVRAAMRVWLVLLCAVWLVLLWTTPDGVWLAFPLFFLQLNLLPVRWGVSAVVATTIAAVAGFSLHKHTIGVGTAIGPVLGAAFAVVTVLGYQALSRESEQRRRLISELTETRAGLAATEHAAGVLAERERLAREIHDTLAQGLSSIQLLLRAAERALPNQADTAMGHIRQARLAAQDNLVEARRFVRALTPPDLEGRSLPAALERLCVTTAERSDLSVNFHLIGDPRELGTAREVAVLRVAQSALANTVRHAHATRADISLSYMDSQVTLDVVDNGTGFDLGGSAAHHGDDSGFGFAAMRARADSLGGALSVESSPGSGTAVAIGFPTEVGDG